MKYQKHFSELSNMQLYKKLGNIFLLLKMYHQSTTIMCWHNTCETVLKQCPIFQIEVQFSTKVDNNTTLHCQLISVTYCSTHFLHHVLVKLVELEHLVGERLDMGCLQKLKRIFLTLFVLRVVSLKVMARPGTSILLFASLHKFICFFWEEKILQAF